LIRYLYLMEQTILPIAFVMHALGWLLLSFETLTAGRALILAWITGLLGTSYTPTLAAWDYFKFSFCYYFCGQHATGVERKSFCGFRFGLIR